jgi:hypothetical protein
MRLKWNRREQLHVGVNFVLSLWVASTGLFRAIGSVARGFRLSA